MVYEALRFIKLVTSGYVAFIALDTLFLGYMMRGIYQSEIGSIARSQNNQMKILLIPGLLVWALLVIGAVVLVLPRCQGLPLTQSFLWGAFYGLIVYGVYDLTNYAVLARWSLFITFIDIAWGMFANGLIVVLLTWLTRFI